MNTDPIDARGAVAGLAELEAALDAVQKLKIPTGPNVMAAEQEAVERIIAGDNLTGEDLVDLMRVALLSEQSSNAAAQTIRNANLRLRDQIHQTEYIGADTALKYLGERLADVLAGARPLVARLQGVDTAEAAIRSKHGDAWTELADLAGLYDQIRGQQREWTVTGYGANNGGTAEQGPIAIRDLERHGVIVEAGKYQPLAGELSGSIRLDGVGVIIRDPAPWPEDGAGFLRWAIDNDVTPWLPTVAELRQAVTDHKAALDHARLVEAGLDTREGREAAQARAAQVEARQNAQIKTLIGERNAHLTMAAADPLYASRMDRLNNH